MIIKKGSLAASVHLLHSLSPRIQERDKFYMSRIVVLELLQALKFKSPLPDTNLLLLVQVTKILSSLQSKIHHSVLSDITIKTCVVEFVSLFVQILVHGSRNPPSSKST